MANRARSIEFRILASAIQILTLLPSLMGSTSAIQSAFDAAFGVLGGTAVVLDVATGRVVASHRLDLAARTVSRPGSVIKPFVLSALRQRQAADLKLVCRRDLEIGSVWLPCTHVPQAEPMDAHHALAYSCNRWFAEASKQLSAAELREMFVSYGFEVPTHLVKEEAIGSVELPANEASKMLEALGARGIRVTPLEMAIAYRKLAIRSDPELVRDLSAAAEWGTAQLAEPFGMQIAAKTGTTTDGAWIAGWSPATKPRFVIVVYLTAGSGGSDVAPIARQIFAALGPDDAHAVRVEVSGSVVTVPFEEYVAGSLAGESGTMRSPESLKAMAVTVRTWAAALRGRHLRAGFNFCSTTHCQEYRPAELTPQVVAAVRLTGGEMLWFEGRPALTYHSRNCGGVTEDASNIWPELHVPYLRQQRDPWCGNQGREEWRADIAKTDIVQSLRAEGLRESSRLDQMSVTKRSPSGRVQLLELNGKPIAGSAFRFAIGRQLGWNLVRSGAFEISNEGSHIVLRGNGSGHGAGLCQTGAARMGEQKRSYAEILAFYYPGTLLSRTAQGLTWRTLSGERVRVLSTRPDQDRALVELGDSLARDVERTLQLSFRAKPEIQIFPDVATFRDGAAEPGWVSASTRENRIRLQPGVGRDVLQHELIHVLTNEHAAANLPGWFQEGLALYFESEQRSRSTDGGDSVAGARPREQMDAAYRTARLRVKQLVAKHGEAAVLRCITSGLPCEWIGPARPTR